MLAELVLAATTGWNAHAQLPGEYSAQVMSRYRLGVARPAWSESVPRRTGTCCHGMERPCAVARGVLGAGRAGMYAPVWGGVHQGRCRSRARRNHGDSATRLSGSLKLQGAGGAAQLCTCAQHDDALLSFSPHNAGRLRAVM